MGVQGLCSLLDSHGRIYRDVQFRTSQLVVDGNNLLHLLYNRSGLDHNHGGQYGAFEELIESFVRTLRDCKISPYVVLDGGTDPSDKKLETVTQRILRRIRKAHQAAVEGKNENILPPLTTMVFKQSLARLEVPVAQCFGEADQEIAALANKLGCPVLSDDSDFFIFDLSAGLLPIKHFSWTEVTQRGSQRYIPCRSYRTSSFSICFSISCKMLPTLAVLAGNDYVKLHRMGTPISWGEFTPAGSETWRSLEGLLCWLKDFQEPGDALQAAVGLMEGLSPQKKAEVLESLFQGMEEYRLPPSSLHVFFTKGTAPPLPKQVSVPIPDWLRLPLTQARLTRDVLDVLQMQRMSLSIHVEHKDTPSANLTSRPLRQVMYGLLLGGGSPLVVQERDRVGLQLTSTPVQPAFKGVAQRLTLSNLNQAALPERRQVLLEALKVDEASLNCLWDHLRLLVAVTCFWLQNAKPTPDEKLLKALLLGLNLRADRNICSRPKLDLMEAHAFNQWQACMKDAIQLNQLLGCPLAEPQLAGLYEGPVVHELVHRMKTTGRLKAILKSDSSSQRQYRTLLTAVHRIQSQRMSKKKDPGADPKSLRRQRPLDDLTVNLQQLFLHDDEAAAEVKSAITAQEDLLLVEHLSVPTRYRTKDRVNRSKNPELVRKQEARGWHIL
ncbi:single-strand DNA endonuclease ASTE1 isoform X2 [Echeneis naucrates]|uniref:single-strand DNA endonuclease ASTE1 isoform X2 n=1 Tax=Echeneis naucrates TaxID=173247 RepID=UPI0011138247|nr:protein asteroid homolog 1-like isoform X2 [Echeneis naucrates]